jgi:hypothetical protein
VNSLDSFDEDEGGTVFRDVIMLALAGFVAMVILLLPHLNPKGEDAQASTEPPGNVIVEVRWPDELDADVDLWVEAPGDVPVGYSNKGGAIFNLLRDDLGRKADATHLLARHPVRRIHDQHPSLPQQRARPAGPGDRGDQRQEIAHRARPPAARQQGRAGARGAGAHGLPLPPVRRGRSGAGQRSLAAARTA